MLDDIEMDDHDNPYTKYESIRKTGMALRYGLYVFVACLLVTGIILLVLQQTHVGVFSSPSTLNTGSISSSSSSTGKIHTHTDMYNCTDTLLRCVIHTLMIWVNIELSEHSLINNHHHPISSMSSIGSADYSGVLGSNNIALQTGLIVWNVNKVGNYGVDQVVQMTLTSDTTKYMIGVITSVNQTALTITVNVQSTHGQTGVPSTPYLFSLISSSSSSTSSSSSSSSSSTSSSSSRSSTSSSSSSSSGSISSVTSPSFVVSYPFDNLATKPYIAVSLRQLFSTAVRAMQVIRVFDAVTLDINFKSDGTLDITSLINFIIAGGSSSQDAAITIWYDQSGNNNHLYTMSGSVTPSIVISRAMITNGINSFPGVLFLGIESGTSYQLGFASAVSMANVGQLSTVLQRTTGTQGDILGTAPSVSGPFNYDSAYGYLFAYCSDDVCGAASILQINDTILADSSAPKSMQWSGNSLNSGLGIVTIITNNPSGTGTSWNNIGKDRSGIHNFNGYYYELVAFSTHISTNDQLIVSKSQTCYYRILNC